MKSLSRINLASAGHKEWVTIGFSLETWKVRCTRLIVGGSLSRTAVGLMTLVIVNGLTKRGPNFLVPPRIGMSLVESHTRCLTRLVEAGIHLRSASCFIRAADLIRLAHVTLQVHLQCCTNVWAHRNPTYSSWLGNKGGWYPSSTWRETSWKPPTWDCL